MYDAKKRIWDGSCPCLDRKVNCVFNVGDLVVVLQMQMASPCYALIGRSIVQPRAVGSTAMCCWRAIPHTITTASLRMKLNVDLEAY